MNEEDVKQLTRVTTLNICDELNSIISKYGDDSLDMIKCYLYHLENGTIKNVE